MIELSVKPGTRLDQLLKFADLVSTGGKAKVRIQSGEVKVNGQVEKRRGYKLKEGDVVAVEDISLKVSIISKEPRVRSQEPE